MNVGDLVTLSARGRKLEICWKWRKKCDDGNLIGLIILVKDGTRSWDHRKKYIIRWLGEGPPGRSRFQSNWHRDDLKFVARIKK